MLKIGAHSSPDSYREVRALDMSTCYILYSPSLDSFYVGCTSDSIENRIDKHLKKFYGSSKYSSKTTDWELYLSISCSSFKIAIKLEKKIKRMKSKKYIANLKLYPEMVQKLLIEVGNSDQTL